MSTTIGIVTFSGSSYTLRSSYVASLRRAGAVPILLPPGEPHIEGILQRIDGLMLAGGGDIEPILYAGTTHPKLYGVDHHRDAFELELARRALQGNVPILGICRGMQLIAVACNAPLITHIPDTFGLNVLHRAETETDEYLPVQHEVLLEPDSQLAHIAGTSSLSVVSWHHQALKEPPKGWRVAGVAPDGVIEAIEHKNHRFAISVQWHPEILSESLEQQQIFQEFVRAASERSFNRGGRKITFI